MNSTHRIGHLEQIFHVLDAYEHYDLGVLHSTVDIEDCLDSMRAPSVGSGPSARMRKRRVILASAIADRSITIPDVTCVIDTRRSLEVRWNPRKSRYDAGTVYASRAICDQRRGRTGRTCAGRAFRLVPEGFYNNEMEPYESPRLGLASCRDEVLSLVSSRNRVTSDPRALLRKCIDPPPDANVTSAIEYLKDVGAVEEVGEFKTLDPTCALLNWFCTNKLSYVYFRRIPRRHTQYICPSSHLSLQKKAHPHGSRRAHVGAPVHG